MVFLKPRALVLLALCGASLHGTSTPLCGQPAATPIPSANFHRLSALVVAHDSVNEQSQIHPDATVNWTTYVSGTTGAGTGRGVAVDSSGNIYTTGFTNDGTTTTAFVAEYNSAGTRIAFTAFQAQDPINQYTQSEGHAIAVDINGSSGVYVAGKAMNVSTGDTDSFIMKFDASNQLMPVANYGAGLGGGANTSAEGVAVDMSGQATITGSFQPTAGETDIFAAQFTPDSSQTNFAIFYTFTNADGSSGNAITMDSRGQCLPSRLHSTDRGRQ